MSKGELHDCNCSSEKVGVSKMLIVWKKNVYNQYQGCTRRDNFPKSLIPMPVSLEAHYPPKTPRPMQIASGSRPDKNAMSNMVQSFPPKCCDCEVE